MKKIILLIFFVLFPQKVFATGTIYVDSTKGTADQVQIQQAIDSLGATGGTVTLGTGTFNLSSSVFVTQNVILQGQGDSTILQAAASLADQFIRVNGSNSTVSNLQIYDQRTAGTGFQTNGIYIWSGNSNRIENVTISGVHIKMVTAGTGASDGINSNYAKTLIYQNNTVEDISGSGLVFNKTDDSTASGNLVVATRTHGIISTGGGNRNTISGNTVRQSGIWQDGKNFCRAITIDGDENRAPSSGHKILNNTVEDSYQGAIELADGISNSVIDGNIINRAGIGTSPTDGFGIWVGGGFAANNQITISNNKISGARDAGIDVHAFSPNPISTDIKILNNEVFNSGLNGIYLGNIKTFSVEKNTCYNNDRTQTDNDGIRLDNSSYGTITNNHCYDTQTPKTQNNGLVFMNQVSHISVYGNDFTGNQFGEIYTDTHAATSNIIYSKLYGDFNNDWKVDGADFKSVLENFSGQGIFKYNELVKGYGKIY